MTCFVFEVKKMRAEISVPDHYFIASETVWSFSYDVMTSFVFDVKKMRAAISVPDHYCIASETVWSSSYDLFCVRGKKDARRNCRSKSLLHSF